MHSGLFDSHQQPDEFGGGWSMPTIFTRIVAGEIPSFKLMENEQFYAFLDIRPINPGHTLVVPKIEVDEFFDLEPTWLKGLMPFAQPIAKALKTVTGQRIGMLVAGFEVPHAHLHLIPIQTEADLDFARARPADPDSLKAIQQQIVGALA